MGDQKQKTKNKKQKTKNKKMGAFVLYLLLSSVNVVLLFGCSNGIYILRKAEESAGTSFPSRVCFHQVSFLSSLFFSFLSFSLFSLFFFPTLSHLSSYTLLLPPPSPLSPLPPPLSLPFPSPFSPLPLPFPSPHLVCSCSYNITVGYVYWVCCYSSSY